MHHILFCFLRLMCLLMSNNLIKLNCTLLANNIKQAKIIEKRDKSIEYFLAEKQIEIVDT